MARSPATREPYQHQGGRDDEDAQYGDRDERPYHPGVDAVRREADLLDVVLHDVIGGLRRLYGELEEARQVGVRSRQVAGAQGVLDPAGHDGAGVERRPQVCDTGPLGLRVGEREELGHRAGEGAERAARVERDAGAGRPHRPDHATSEVRELVAYARPDRHGLRLLVSDPLQLTERGLERSRHDNEDRHEPDEQADDGGGERLLDVPARLDTGVVRASFAGRSRTLRRGDLL